MDVEALCIASSVYPRDLSCVGSGVSELRWKKIGWQATTVRGRSARSREACRWRLERVRRARQAWLPSLSALVPSFVRLVLLISFSSPDGSLSRRASPSTTWSPARVAESADGLSQNLSVSAPTQRPACTTARGWDRLRSTTVQVPTKKKKTARQQAPRDAFGSPFHWTGAGLRSGLRRFALSWLLPSHATGAPTQFADA